MLWPRPGLTSSSSSRRRPTTRPCRVPQSRAWRRAVRPRRWRPATVYTANFERGWSISSYSALVRDAGRAASGSVPARRLRDDEPGEGAATPQRPALQAWHRFPRGAMAGNFLHDQLEWLAGEAVRAR